jgi:gluconolactonase
MAAGLERFTELTGGLDHPEGVAWDPDGRVYAGGEAGQISAIELDGRTSEIASTGGFIYGVTLDGAGNVYACDFGNASVMQIAASGEVSTYSTGAPDRPLRVPNFACFDDSGNLYVTDSGEWGRDDGAVFRIAPGGATSLFTDEPSRYPNGCCVSADGGSLLVVQSNGRGIDRVRIRDDGSAGPVEPVVELPDSFPDGIALAGDGTMLVGCYRPDRIYRIWPDRVVDVLAEDPDGVVLNQPANVAFVGPALDRIVVSSLGGWSLMIADIGIRGLPLRYPVA